MTFELWKKIIDEIAEKAPDTAIWPAFMGEPFAQGKEFFDFIRYATGQGVGNIRLNTNLLLFKEKWIDDLFTCGLRELIISIDGLTQETYEKIRLKGNLKRFNEKLYFILDERKRRGLSVEEFPIQLQFIVMDENKHEEKAFIDYWKDSGYHVSLKVKPRCGWSDGVEPYREIMNLGMDERIPCTWLLRETVIYHDGTVPQCSGDWDARTNMGNLRDSSIEELWNTSMLAVRRNHLEGKFAIKLCRECNDWQSGTSVYVQT